MADASSIKTYLKHAIEELDGYISGEKTPYGHYGSISEAREYINDALWELKSEEEKDKDRKREVKFSNGSMS